MREIDAKIEELKVYLQEFIDEHGYPPSVREICRALNIKSTASVYYYMEKLEAAGFLKKARTKNRALEIVGRKEIRAEIVNVPLVGKIPAGIPVLAQENIEEIYPLPRGLFKSGELFMLTASGDSMMDAGIFNRDILILRKQETAENGEIVAAMIDGEATVKRYFRETGHIRLQPENDAFEPIIATDVEIIGIVVGLIRNNMGGRWAGYINR